VRPIFSLKKQPHFKTRKCLERKKYDHGVQKPRTTVLARSNLLDWITKIISKIAIEIFLHGNSGKHDVKGKCPCTMKMYVEVGEYLHHS
jgi:hypothetical protein